MVKRYPHTAVITLETKDSIVKGVYVKGEPEYLIIQGRYEPVDVRFETIKRNILGDEKRVRGTFYTKVRPPQEAKPIHIKIDQLSIDLDIICWDPFQTHSIISL